MILAQQRQHRLQPAAGLSFAVALCLALFLQATPLCGWGAWPKALVGKAIPTSNNNSSRTAEEIPDDVVEETAKKTVCARDERRRHAGPPPTVAGVRKQHSTQVHGAAYTSLMLQRPVRAGAGCTLRI